MNVNYPQNKPLSKSTYISGNPLSYSTIPNLKRKHYNFNMPKFDSNGKVLTSINTNNNVHRIQDDNNNNNNNIDKKEITNTIVLTEPTNVNVDDPKLRVRTQQNENINRLNNDIAYKENKADSLNIMNIGEKYIYQSKEKSIDLGKSQFKMKNSGTMLRSSVIRANNSSMLKKSALPTVGNKCALTTTTYIQIGENFDSRNVDADNVKDSINTGIAGKKSESRIVS